MKINRIQKRAAVAALVACAAFAGVASAESADKTQEKIRLMVTAVQARDNGDFKASKQALEELVKLAPKDESVQRMLSDVNADIERQAKGEKPVLASKEAVEKIAAQQEEAKEAAAAAEGLLSKEIKVALMGCVVNGPGEAREADIGIAGGIGEAALIKKGEIIEKIPESDIIPRLIAEIKKM